jgi:tRNA (cytidine32/uridine32-2'-O)-methyltransferase
VTQSTDTGSAESSIPLLGAMRIVLVGTSHPGNIGASARAMKAMGVNQLALVSPKQFPAAAATAMASGADDLLENAHVVNSLEEALVGCEVVFGTTARDRHLEWPVLSPHEAAAKAVNAMARGPVAFVFGREQSGLSNAELDRCQHAIRIPTEPDFNSLNLSQAVQICVYEARNAFIAASTDSRRAEQPTDADPIANNETLEQLHGHLMTSMESVGYFKPADPRLLERRVRRMLNGANMRHTETQILRGFLTAIARTIKRNNDGADDAG